MLINRNLYLQRLVSRMHNGMVKVITGIRRSGKSFLLFEKHIEITGLLDSGNTLYDTKTGKAVIVVSTKVLKRVLNSEEYNQVLKGDFSVLKNCDEIEYVSVGGIQAQMPIVRDVTVKVKSLSETVSKSCVIGFVNQTFTSDKIECLVHKDFV